MVCRENQAVTCPQSIQDAWQLTVEIDQGFRVTVCVAAMAVLRVEVVEIREAKTAAIAVEPLDGARDALVVVGCSLTGRNTLAAEYIADLADAARRNTRVLEDFKHARRRRRDGVIAAVCGPDEMTLLADEWPRDDSVDSIRRDEHLSRARAPIPQRLDRHDVF